MPFLYIYFFLVFFLNEKFSRLCFADRVLVIVFGASSSFRVFFFSFFYVMRFCAVTHIHGESIRWCSSVNLWD